MPDSVGKKHQRLPECSAQYKVAGKLLVGLAKMLRELKRILLCKENRLKGNMLWRIKNLAKPVVPIITVNSLEFNPLAGLKNFTALEKINGRGADNRKNAFVKSSGIP
ncbi:MAG: hypothetical protein IIU30_09755 [Treponema sp.]|nr:hypothetical protein [Treponema sp.]